MAEARCICGQLTVPGEKFCQDCLDSMKEQYEEQQELNLVEQIFYEKRVREQEARDYKRFNK